MTKLQATLRIAQARFANQLLRLIEQAVDGAAADRARAELASEPVAPARRQQPTASGQAIKKGALPKTSRKEALNKAAAQSSPGEAQAKKSSGRGAQPGAGAGPRAARSQAAPPKAPESKRIRRSSLPIASDADRILKLLQSNPGGLRIEQINERLGTSTQQLAPVMAKLSAEGRIGKHGQRRGTTYSVG